MFGASTPDHHDLACHAGRDASGGSQSRAGYGVSRPNGDCRDWRVDFIDPVEPGVRASVFQLHAAVQRLAVATPGTVHSIAAAMSLGLEIKEPVPLSISSICTYAVAASQP